MKRGTPTNDLIAAWLLPYVRSIMVPRADYAELESVTPDSRPDPTVNTDGKPKRKKKRKRRAQPK